MDIAAKKLGENQFYIIVSENSKKLMKKSKVHAEIAEMAREMYKKNDRFKIGLVTLKKGKLTQADVDAFIEGKRDFSRIIK